MVMLFSVMLVICGTMQAVTFKRAGYSLGPYPYFILISVSLSFVPLLFAVVAYVHWRAGGFVGDQTSWAFKKHFAVIGALNALNGVQVIFSNPHVPGTGAHNLLYRS
jgi:hypothetical protein